MKQLRTLLWIIGIIVISLLLMAPPRSGGVAGVQKQAPDPITSPK